MSNHPFKVASEIARDQAAKNSPPSEYTVAVLAKELDIGPNDMLKLARSAGVYVARQAAILNQAQVMKIKSYAADQKAKQDAAYLRVQRPTVPPPTVIDLTVPATTPPPSRRVGPPHACDCCGVDVSHMPRIEGEFIKRCAPCTDHYPIAGEDDQRVMARLTNHESRLRFAYQNIWERDIDSTSRMKGALRTRDTWRATLVTTALAHERKGTGCCCGASTFPCFTVRKIEQTNRGIARRIEEFGAMTDDELEKELYGDRWEYDPDD
jgi:hypothetical protein